MQLTAEQLYDMYISAMRQQCVDVENYSELPTYEKYAWETLANQLRLI